MAEKHSRWTLPHRSTPALSVDGQRVRVCVVGRRLGAGLLAPGSALTGGATPASLLADSWSERRYS